MFEYASRKKYLSENPMDKVKIYVRFRQVNKKSGRTETYNQYLGRMYTETRDCAFLAVKLNFLLDLRVGGELVALKWEDITDATHLHITREETRNQYTNTYEVVEHTKTNRDRYVVLVPKALEILKRIKRQGKKTKSTHKMRKTFASNLNANGVPLDCIRELMGHSSLNTTLGYIYNPLTEEETYKRISSSLE